MSVTGYYTGNVETPISALLTNTTKTKIGDTAANDTLTLASWMFCNDNGASVVCQLYWWDSRNAVERLVWQKSVSNDDSLGASDLPLRLSSGDEIRVVANSNVTVTLSYILNFALTSR